MALINNRDIIKTYSTATLLPEIIKDFIDGFKVESSIISSVRNHVEDIEEFLAESTNYYRFSTSLKTPVKILYKTPATLGLDRYAAVIGASTVFKNTNCLVIDAGTCITYDFIDRDRNYYGGSISPGINMRYKAMHSFTGKLPLIDFDPEFHENNGTDTATSILSGVQNGITYEILGFIQSYQLKYPDLKIALCGGDSNYFDSQLKNSIFAPKVKTIPDLVLIGLNEVIQQHDD